jgi:hypothetical protein
MRLAPVVKVPNKEFNELDAHLVSKVIKDVYRATDVTAEEVLGTGLLRKWGDTEVELGNQEDKHDDQSKPLTPWSERIVERQRLVRNILSTKSAEEANMRYVDEAPLQERRNTDLIISLTRPSKANRGEVLTTYH